jgi:hypothetical protein
VRGKATHVVFFVDETHAVVVPRVALWIELVRRGLFPPEELAQTYSLVAADAASLYGTTIADTSGLAVVPAVAATVAYRVSERDGKVVIPFVREPRAAHQTMYQRQGKSDLILYVTVAEFLDMVGGIAVERWTVTDPTPPPTRLAVTAV